MDEDLLTLELDEANRLSRRSNDRKSSVLETPPVLLLLRDSFTLHEDNDLGVWVLVLGIEDELMRCLRVNTSFVVDELS